MDTAQILADLRAERGRIDNAIAALEALDGTKPVGKPATVQDAKEAGQKVRRTLSPAGRRKIAVAQKARWAAKKKQAGLVTDAKQSAPKKIATKTANRVVSAESRKKMAEAQQKRWAKKRRATKAAAKKAAAAPVAATAAKEAPKA
jgi:hypothetical protein